MERQPADRIHADFSIASTLSCRQLKQNIAISKVIPLKNGTIDIFYYFNTMLLINKNVIQLEKYSNETFRPVVVPNSSKGRPLAINKDSVFDIWYKHIFTHMKRL